MIDWIGQTLKQRYRIESSLGRGGMAEVYKVWDRQPGSLEPRQAIRFIPPQHSPHHFNLPPPIIGKQNQLYLYEMPIQDILFPDNQAESSFGHV